MSLLAPSTLAPILSRVREANAAFDRHFPGDPTARAPIHTVYGGAHLFRADIAAKLGSIALQTMSVHMPDFASFGRAAHLHGELPEDPSEVVAVERALASDRDRLRRTNPAAWVAAVVRERVVKKLEREPIEDYRIDFEDGYGERDDAEEDEHARAAAREVARGTREKLLPPFLGIRVKSLSDATCVRSFRTLDVFFSELFASGNDALPNGFVVTLPKVTSPAHVSALADAIAGIEAARGLPPRTIAMELMIEATQAVIDHEGRCALPSLAAAAGGRCVAVHLGAYDYTASMNVSSAHQTMDHPACDFARILLQHVFARSGIRVSDGATTAVPVPVHRGAHLGGNDDNENREAIARAFALHARNIRRQLSFGINQGWDLHPAQLPIRYAVTYAFYLESLDPAGARLRSFVERAARATERGGTFDDAATAQGLVNHFCRALGSGAVSEAEVEAATGLGAAELRTRSFRTIVGARAKH